MQTVIRNRHQKLVAKSVLLVLGMLLLTDSAKAHVKWFSEFTFLDSPLTLREIATPLFFTLVLLSVTVIALFVLAEYKFNKLTWYNRINQWLSNQKEHSTAVIRFAMAITLLLTWSNNTLLAPELTVTSSTIIWLQFFIAILLLFPRTAVAGGVGILILYAIATVQFGFFHMLDYLHYIGIGLYLIFVQFKDEKLYGLALPAIYITVGSALIWLGFEKLVYPSWGLSILTEHPMLTLGLPAEFFLTSAAFVEIALGYLLIIGLLERPLAMVITLVFFSTTVVFGKVEVIGHLPLHAVLILFLFEGSGTVFKPPIDIHKKLPLRTAFGMVNFVLILILFGFSYTSVAQRQYDTKLAEYNANLNLFELSGDVPSFTTFDVIDAGGGDFNLFVEIDNWQFTPELTGQSSVANEGHGHIFIDGEKSGRLYNNYAHLGSLTPGEHTITVTLNGNDHADFAVEGQLIKESRTIHVEQTETPFQHDGR